MRTRLQQHVNCREHIAGSQCGPLLPTTDAAIGIVKYSPEMVRPLFEKLGKRSLINEHDEGNGCYHEQNKKRVYKPFHYFFGHDFVDAPSGNPCRDGICVGKLFFSSKREKTYKHRKVRIAKGTSLTHKSKKKKKKTRSKLGLPIP